MDELIGPLPRTGGHRACELGPAENNLIPDAHLRFAGYRITAFATNTTRAQLARPQLRHAQLDTRPGPLPLGHRG